MIDESFSTAAPAAVKAAGVEVVMMYLSPTPGKNATVAKIRGYHRVGVGVLLGWESYAARSLEGEAAGRADASSALAQLEALEKGCGYSCGPVAIVFAVDFAATAAQFPEICGYFRGAKGVLDHAGLRTGVYGDDAVVEMLAKAGLTSTEWQTYAWSGGRLSPHADAFQWLNGQHMGGASVDFGSVLHVDELGVWWPQGDKRNGAGMAISDADAAKIARHVWAQKATGTDKGDSERRVDVAAVTAMNRVYGVQRDLAAVRQDVERLSSKVDSIAQILGAAKSGVADRVAALGAAVAALKPSSAVQLDAAAVADAVTAKLTPASIAAAVEAKVKAITWKAGQ
jgi:hypothetical protein